MTDGLWIEECGPPDAPLVAVVHGAMDRSDSIARLAELLSGRYRVVRYDRRGYGRSTPHAGPFDIDANVSDLVAVLDGRPAVVVAHSHGSHVALRAAELRPDLVKGVALHEPSMPWVSWWPDNASEAVQLSRTSLDAGAVVMLRAMFGSEAWDALTDHARAERLVEGRTTLSELLAVKSTPPWDPSAIDVPLRIGYGGRGLSRFREAAESIAASVAGASVVEIPGTAHNAPRTHPELVVALAVEPVLDAVFNRRT
jgi:pimeloyl-ACP methyl ester carboxylesterase